MQNLRTVTEQSESAEPLLSRQLYETIRRTSQVSPEKNLEDAQRAMERNFLPQAQAEHEKAEQTIRTLREGVERAAESVLGDEAESLRFAERELQNLAERVERELQAATGRGSTNGAAGDGGAQSSTNLTSAAAGRERGTNTLSGMLEAASTNRAGPARLANRGEENRQDGQSRESSGQPGEQASPGQQGQNEGSQPGQGQGQARAGNQQRGGQPGQEGEGGRQQLAQNQGNQPGGQNSRNGGQRNFFDRLGGADGGNGGGGAWEGPLTGSNFTRWSDRLRDVEEVLQDPGLRLDVARVREQARMWRAEYKRHSNEPQWSILEDQVINPLRILQKRVADELARHGSRDAVVPVDRDPVPQKYTDLVSRYYEQLGKE
jgi:hypothetical protein